MKWLKQLLTKQDSVQLALQELEEAERSLLIAQSGQEYAASMVAYHSARIVRLEQYIRAHKSTDDRHLRIPAQEY